MFLFWLFLLLFNTQIVQTQNGAFTELVGKNYNIKNFKILKTRNRGKVKITFLEDHNGNKFCVKQLIREASIESVRFNKTATFFGAVRAVLASYVAESALLPINKIRIIPHGVEFPGKDTDSIATLHTFVPGTSKSYSRKIVVQQRLSNKISSQKHGLCLKVIHDMSFHEDLPKIVAFDTFISNTDRGSSNLFYDAVKDRFFGIDLEWAFKLPRVRDLGVVAYRQLKKINRKSRKLSRVKKIALKRYLNTLKQLVDNNFPKEMSNLLRKIAQYAGFVHRKKKIDYISDSVNPDNNMELYIRKHEEKIKSQYTNILKLIRLLEFMLRRWGVRL